MLRNALAAPSTLNGINMRFVLSLLAVIVLAVAAPAAAKPAVKIAQRPYDHVRAELSRNGFRPVRLKHNRSDLLCDDGFCVRYPEVVDCAGTGIRPCLFAFVRTADHKYFMVGTHGEDRLIADRMWPARDMDIHDIRARL
jgi:hypothetical protein